MFNLIKIYSLGIGVTGTRAIITKIIKIIKYIYITRRDYIILLVIKYRYSLLILINYIIILITKTRIIVFSLNLLIIISALPKLRR
jgi:hypothetical protein